ncbi:MAG: MBL fold metallo-hydrolase [Candidatus Omnitrophota bacterium]
MSAILEQMQVGPMENFIYFIGCPDTKDVAVVDPAWDVDHLTAQAEEKGYRIAAVLLTHGHPDHVQGAGRIAEQLDVPVYISADEAPFYEPDSPNLKKVNDGDEISIGNIHIRCAAAPGHTPGCLCFQHGNILLTGDTLFVNGCGRCDLPGGNAEKMYHTLYDRLAQFPDETVIYPGHKYGPAAHDTLGNQRKTNPYLTCADKKEFLTKRMGG